MIKKIAVSSGAWMLVLLAAPAMGELVVHLPMNEGSGDTIYNMGATRSFNDGSLDINNTFASGQLGTGVMFDGTAASTFAAGPTPILGGTQRSVSAWINTVGGAGLDSILSFGPSDTGAKFDFDVDNNNGGHLEIGVGGGRTNFSGVTPAVNDGVWHLVTVVLPDVADPTLENLQFYVDGQFAYDGTGGGNAQIVSTGGGGSLVLGRSANSDATQPFLGTIDDVAIWDQALTVDELISLYDVGDDAGTAIDAGGFNLLKRVHDDGSGSAVVNNIQWDYATGLTAPAGLSGSGPNYTLVLNDGANTGLTTTGVSFSPGDVNLDDDVNLSDLQIIADNYLIEAERTSGDLSGDLFVDAFDYSIWRDAAPAALQGFTVENVPEPASMALCSAAALGLLAFRRRLRAKLFLPVCMITACLLGATAERAHAQSDVLWNNTGIGNYTDVTNWDGNFVPEANFDEVGIIQNGGTAFVDSVVPANQFPGGLILGRNGGNTGTLEIRTGGSLNVIQGTDTITNGSLIVGQNSGRGFVDVQSGGSLSAHIITTSGNTPNPIFNLPASRLTVSGTGSLNATLDPEMEGGNITVNAEMKIVGPSATVSAANNFNMGGGGTLIAEITGPTHSVIAAAAGANLNGNLNVEFNGVTPSFGDSWTLFDAGSVSGAYDNINVNVGVSPGQRYSIETASGGTNGTLGNLTLGRVLALEVNRDTGQLAVRNPFGPTEDISGYGILSASGSLDPSAWNSLQDQGNSDWIEANPTATALTELKTTGFTTVGSDLVLGNAWAPPVPMAFGEEVTADLTFEYAVAGNELIQGDVYYTGSSFNNLVLTVDPATGQGQLKNASSFTVDITDYSILSESGSLDPTGWDSLQDQGVAGWLEANPLSTALSEVQGGAAETLAPNTAFDLGSLFTVGGAQDLSFNFLLDGEIATLDGVVVYGAIASGPQCDFDGDGDCGLSDIDMLIADVAAGAGDLTFDLTGDGVVNLADRDRWLELAGAENLPSGNPYLLGDANLSGEVDVSDFNTWNGNKFTATAAWSLADFDATGNTDVSDFNIWNNNKFRSSDGVSAVPEPSALALALICLCLGGRCWATRRNS